MAVDLQAVPCLRAVSNINVLNLEIDSTTMLLSMVYIYT